MKRLYKLSIFLLVVFFSVSYAPEKSVAAKKIALHKTQVLTYNLKYEPEILDPDRSTGVPENEVEMACFEGLARRGVNDVAVPGAAAKWTVSPDGKTYTFRLRKNAKWSNGDPVTAADFEYAWKRLLNPQLAAEYASSLYVLVNGEEYNSGKISDASKVGVKAKDPLTLVVNFKTPFP
jgi:oligopeptide transport system substrate-binding protein